MWIVNNRHAPLTANHRRVAMCKRTQPLIARLRKMNKMLPFDKSSKAPKSVRTTQYKKVTNRNQISIALFIFVYNRENSLEPAERCECKQINVVANQPLDVLFQVQTNHQPKSQLFSFPRNFVGENLARNGTMTHSLCLWFGNLYDTPPQGHWQSEQNFSDAVRLCLVARDHQIKFYSYFYRLQFQNDSFYLGVLFATQRDATENFDTFVRYQKRWQWWRRCWLWHGHNIGNITYSNFHIVKSIFTWDESNTHSHTRT